MKLSPVLLAGGVEFGRANGFVHIWAYSSLDQRARVRDDARQKGVWPPPGGPDRLLTQENKILLPASFSPLQKARSLGLSGCRERPATSAARPGLRATWQSS